MGRLGPILAALICGGCHLVFPFDTETDGQAPALDADGGPPADLKLGDGDALTALTIAIKAPDPSEVKVGQHTPVGLTLSGYQGNVAVKMVASGGCLLAVPGKNRAVASYSVDLPSPGELVAHLFAPPAVQPGIQCSVVFSVPAAKVKPGVTLTVTDPEYEILFLQTDAVQGMKGLKVTRIGALQYTGTIQGVVHAGGSFGGDFVVGTGTGSKSTSNPVTPSTVRVYRFRGDLSSVGTVQPTLDLYGSNQNPTVLDGLAWSDKGPCAPDGIYLAAHYSDYAYEKDPEQGSITCMDSNDTLTQIINDNARAVSVVPVAGFFANAALGSVIYSSDSTTYLYPGPYTVDMIAAGTNQMVFAPAGLHKGHLYLIKTTSSRPLLRISPPPGQQAFPLRDLNDSDIRFSLSAGGIFGPMVVTAERGVQSSYYDLIGLAEEGNSVREVTLLQEVPCGRHFAMNSEGNYMVLLAPPASAGCNGPWSIYRLEFELP